MDAPGVTTDRRAGEPLRRVVILLARRASGEPVEEERIARALAELIEAGERRRVRPWTEREWRSPEVQATLAWALGERRSE